MLSSEKDYWSTVSTCTVPQVGGEVIFQELLWGILEVKGGRRGHKR